MRARRLAAWAAVVVLAGPVGATAVGATAAGAEAAAYRSAAGCYLPTFGGPLLGSQFGTLVLATDGTWTMTDDLHGSGTWSQPGDHDLLVFDGVVDGLTFHATVPKGPDGLGLQRTQPGRWTAGTDHGSWFANRDCNP